MKRDLLFVVERLANFLDENRLAVLARQYGIKKAKDDDSIGMPPLSLAVDQKRRMFSLP
jgi:hypothetical protein